MPAVPARDCLRSWMLLSCPEHADKSLWYLNSIWYQNIFLQYKKSSLTYSNKLMFLFVAACDGDPAVAACLNGLCGQGYFCSFVVVAQGLVLGGGWLLRLGFPIGWRDWYECSRVDRAGEQVEDMVRHVVRGTDVSYDVGGACLPGQGMLTSSWMRGGWPPKSMFDS